MPPWMIPSCTETLETFDDTKLSVNAYLQENQLYLCVPTKQSLVDVFLGLTLCFYNICLRESAKNNDICYYELQVLCSFPVL